MSLRFAHAKSLLKHTHRDTHTDTHRICLSRCSISLPFWSILESCKSCSKSCKKKLGDDLQKMLRDCPGAGKALMESSTFRPADRSDGYNKLPERVSLAPRNLLSRLLGLSPFCFRFKCFYETDTEWKEERKWHSPLAGSRWK